MDSASCRPSVSKALLKWHKRFSDRRVSQIWQSHSYYERALMLLREVTDTDRRSTAGDTAVMCDLKRTTVQYIFKVGVQTLGMYSVWWRNV